MLEKLRLRQFCCCCTLQTGSLVIGTLGWIGSVIHVTKIQDTTMSEESKSMTFQILTGILSIGLSIALVYGVYKSNRKFILPWLVLKFVELILLAILFLICFFAMFVTEDPGAFAIIFIIVLIISLLSVYCWLCVWSLYMDLGETQEVHVTEMIEEIRMDYHSPHGNKVGFEGYEQNYPQQEMV